MIRFLLYLVLGYLVYLYFIKPIVSGYKQPSSKEKTKVHKKEKDKDRFSKEGEYIDYEEVK